MRPPANATAANTSETENASAAPTSTSLTVRTASSTMLAGIGLPPVASGSAANVTPSASNSFARTGISRDENTGAIRNTPDTRASVSANAGAPKAAKLVRISTAPPLPQRSGHVRDLVVDVG